MYVKLGFAGIAVAAILFVAQLSAQPVVAQTVTPPSPTATPDDYADDRRILNGDRAVFGEGFVLRGSETLRGDLAIFGGDVILERGSVVEGDVALFGGSLRAAGRINGDLVQMGGEVELNDTARVEGQSIRFGGGRSVMPGAYMREDAQNQMFTGRWFMPNFMRSMPGVDGRWDWGGLGSDIWKVFPGALLITLLALLCWAVVPRNIDRAVDAARARPMYVGGIGALALIFGAVALVVSLVLIVTLCVNPLIALAAISLSWTVTARILGAEAARAFDRTGWTPTGQVVVGSLLMALLGAIPLAGDLLGFAFTAFGLGALVLTRLGTREWRPAAGGPPPADRRPPVEEGPSIADRRPSAGEEPLPPL